MRGLDVMPLVGVPFSDTKRRLVNRLADGLVPLSLWITQKQFEPVLRPPFKPSIGLPWRNQQALTASELGFDQFFEGLMIETSEDSDLKMRWDWIAKQPLRLCPTPEAASWRESRGMAESPIFSAVVSDNSLLAVETRLVSRAEFYAPFWPLLEDTYERADKQASFPNTPLDELDFASSLLSDTNSNWPTTGESSSRFCKQFVKDVLYCYLGLRNPCGEPWQHAVLIELGERRRVGNKYGLTDCEIAVQSFNSILKIMNTPTDQPIGIEQRKLHTTAIGSPPVNARDLI